MPTRPAPEPAHCRDEDCTLDATDCCTECGVYHGDPCPTCGARGYHRAAYLREYCGAAVFPQPLSVDSVDTLRRRARET